MRKSILALAFVALAFVSCSKSDITPDASKPFTLELVSGRMLNVQTTDTTFIMVANFGPIQVKGKDLIVQNLSRQDAILKINGKAEGIKPGQIFRQSE